MGSLAAIYPLATELMGVSIEEKNIKLPHASIAILLIGFLLLAPCKVRHFIQAQLGVPLTEVATPSKSALGQHDCQVLAVPVSALAQGPRATSHPPIDAPIIAPGLRLGGHSRLDAAAPLRRASAPVASAVPLYVWYQHFKLGG